MPTAQVIVRQANGQSLVLSENDRIVKEVTISCESRKCASRHGQDKPVSFTFNDHDPFPEAGDNFMSLILPERSPSNGQYPRPFCSPTCLRDYLMYEYLAPSSRNPETVQPPVTIEAATQIAESQADGCADPADVHGV